MNTQRISCSWKAASRNSRPSRCFQAAWDHFLTRSELKQLSEQLIHVQELENGECVRRAETT